MAIEECAYKEEHPRIDERLQQLEDRAEKQDAQIEAVKNLATQINVQLASLQGRIAGAVWAAGSIGAIVGAVVGVGVQFLKR